MSNSTNIMVMPVDTSEQRIEKALAIIVAWGRTDGAHHKDWVLDQAVRALTGCPIETVQAKDYKGNSYEYASQAAGEAYQALVQEACAGVDGPNTYGWEVGIAP